MGKAAKAVHESVHAVGRSATETRQIVATALSGDAEYQVVELNASTYQVVRSTQTLLMRKVETCTLTVADGSTGATLTISGKLLDDRLERIKAALTERRTASIDASPPVTLTPLAASSPVVPAPPAFPVSPAVSAPPAVPEPSIVPATAPDAAADETIVRGPGTVPSARPVAPVTAPPAMIDVPRAIVSSTPVSSVARTRFELRFDDGEVRQLACTVVIGRDPSDTAGGPGAVRMVVEDPQVSKAHASLGVDEAGVWVEDLHSTNGTFVHVHGREPISVLSGQRHRLEPGSVVRFGTRFVTLARAD